MTKKVEKKKPASKKRKQVKTVVKAKAKVKAMAKANSKKLRRRTPSSDFSRSRTQATLKAMTRTNTHSRPSELTAYLAMGLLVMSLAVVVVTFQGLRKRYAPPSLAYRPANTQPILRNPSSVETPVSSPLVTDFQKVQKYDLPKKLDYWSSLVERDHEKRKVLTQLGQQIFIEDTAPLFPGKYDCTTFVETVAALARSQSSEQVVKNLTMIRYQDGLTKFSHRNHFPEGDWIPNNQKNHVLVDITKRISISTGVPLKTETKQIEKLKWLKSQVRRSAVPDALAKEAQQTWTDSNLAQVDYIEMEDFLKILSQIPNGTVVNLVHTNHPKRAVLIAHQGFIIQKESGTYFRHASIGGRIRTNRFEDYINHLQKQFGPNSNWPLIGVNLNQINASTSASSLRNDSM